MSPYIIYTYFNATQMQFILNAVVGLVGSGGVDGDYLSLIRVAGGIGLMIAVVGGIAKARGENAGMYIVMMALFYSTLFTPRVTVTIQDAGGTGSPINVDNVPLGLAFFASTTSHIGYWFTEKSETFFTLPDNNMQFSSSGLMGMARTLREASSAAVQGPVLFGDLTNFMRDCINPELAAAPAQVTNLMASRQIWADFQNFSLINAGRFVQISSGGTQVTDCQTAYTTLTPFLSAEVTGAVARIAQAVSPNATPAAAATILGSLLPASEGMIMTASGSASEAVQQRMMINVLNDTSKSMAQILNDPTAATNAASLAMAEQASNSSYQLLAKLAAETLPMVHNAVELLVVGVFPIVLVLIIIAGHMGGTVLRSYAMTMIWVQLWAPLYAICNYIATLAAATQMKAALAGIDGATVYNAGAILNAGISAESVAGVLTISVPVIAMALVKGGEVAMSGMASSLMGPATQAASRTAAATSAGNFSGGNVQWGSWSANNVGMNKYDTDVSHRSGAVSTRNDAGDMRTRFGDGTATLAQAKHDSLITGSQLGQAGRELGQQASRVITAGFAEANMAQTSLTAAFNNMLSAMRGRTLANQNTSGAAQVEQGSFGLNNGLNLNNGTQVAGTGVVGTASSAQMRGNLGLNGNAGIGTPGSFGKKPQDEKGGKGGKDKLGGPVTAGGGLTGAIAAVQTYDARIGKALEEKDLSSATRALDEKQSYLNQLSKTWGFQHSDTGATGRAAAVSAQLSEATGHIHNAQASYQRAESLGNSSRILEGASSSAGYAGAADPKVMTADRLSQLTGALRQANPDQRVVMLEGLARELGGAGITSHAARYMDGTGIKTKDGQLGQQFEADSNSQAVAADVRGQDRGNRAKVPGGEGGLGAGAVGDGRGLDNRAGDFISRSRAAGEAAKGELARGHGQDLTRFQGESGFLNPDLKNPRETLSHAKLGNYAAGLQGGDFALSAGQLIPNALGGVPTQEQFMNSLGVPPENPGAAPAAPVPALKSGTQPVAPLDWRPPAPKNWDRLSSRP